MTDPKEENISYAGMEVTAFIDIQGHGSRLLRIPSRGFGKETLGKLKRIAGEVVTVRRDFRDAVPPPADSITELVEKGLISNQGERFKDPRIRVFSDSIIASILLIKSKDQVLPLSNILRIVSAVATTMALANARETAVRGGIEIGPAIEIPGTDDTPTPAAQLETVAVSLAKAAKIESTVATYPRIVVGPELIDFLRLLRQGVDDTTVGRVRGVLLDLLGRLLFQDQDGRTIIDYLGPYHLGLVPDFEELLGPICRFIRQNCDRYRYDDKLGPRYESLRLYAVTRLGPERFNQLVC